MIELIGVALMVALIVIAAVIYLFVYYFRYRWQLKDLEQENRRLIDQVIMLERENELLRQSLGPGHVERRIQKTKE